MISPYKFLESGKQVVAGDCEYFQLLREKEPTLAEPDILHK